MQKYAWCVLIVLALLSGCLTKKEVEGIRSFHTEQADGLRAEIATLKQELRQSQAETTAIKQRFQALKSVLEAGYGQTTARSLALRNLARCKADLAEHGWSCQLRAELQPKPECAQEDIPASDRPYNTEARTKEEGALIAAGLTGTQYQVVSPVGMTRGCKYSFSYTVIILVE